MPTARRRGTSKPGSSSADDYPIRVVPTIVLDTVDDDVGLTVNPLLLPPRGAPTKRHVLRLHAMSPAGVSSCVTLGSVAELEAQLDDVLAVITRPDSLSTLRTRGALVLVGSGGSEPSDGLSVADAPPASVVKSAERTASGTGAQNSTTVLPTRASVATTMLSWFGKTATPLSTSGAASGTGSSRTVGVSSRSVLSSVGSVSSLHARKRLVIQPYVTPVGHRPWYAPTVCLCVSTGACPKLWASILRRCLLVASCSLLVASC
jgi:hypothetical protein